MELHETLHLPLSAAAAARMYADPAYSAIRGSTLHAEDVTAEVEGDPAGAFTVRTTLRLPTAGVPDMVKRFVGAQVTVHETQRWQAPAADGSREGSTELEVAGAPARMTADLHLRPAGSEAAEVAIDGELVAKVPLLGRKIEQAALPYVSRVLGAEQRAAASYAQERPASA